MSKMYKVIFNNNEVLVESEALNKVKIVQNKKTINKNKSEMIFEEGFKLIRLREEPLKKIYDTDVISKQPYNGKQVINDTLSMIMYIFELDAKLVSKIKDYQSKEGLQNEKGLDRYIDKILTEKSREEI